MFHKVNKTMDHKQTFNGHFNDLEQIYVNP